LRRRIARRRRWGKIVRQVIILASNSGFRLKMLKRRRPARASRQATRGHSTSRHRARNHDPQSRTFKAVCMKLILPKGSYYGCRNLSRKAGLLVLTESSFEPELRIPRHSHENAYFIFTLSGGQEESFGARNRTYSPGTLAFHPAAGEALSSSPAPAPLASRATWASAGSGDPSSLRSSTLWCGPCCYRGFASRNPR